MGVGATQTEQSKSVRLSLEITAIATTVVAIVVLALVTGEETPFRVWSTVALVVLLALLVLAFAGGFGRLSSRLQNRRTRLAIARHPDLVRRLGAVTVRAKDVFGPAAKIITFSYAAGTVSNSAQRSLSAATT